MSTPPAMLLLLGGAMNLIQPAFAVEGTAQYGYSESVIRPLGVVLLVCTVAYLVPRTSVLGKILLTGYLRGASATHVRHGDGPIEILIPVLFGGLHGVASTCATLGSGHSFRCENRGATHFPA